MRTGSTIPARWPGWSSRSWRTRPTSWSARAGWARRRAAATRAPATPGITVYTRLINLLGGTEVSDIANGYRAIRASRLAEIAFTEDQFHNPELLLGAARAGLRVVDVPVTIRRRTAGVTKKGTNVRYGLGFLRVMLKTVVALATTCP